MGGPRPSGGAVIGQSHRVPELRPVHDSGADERRRLERAAQLAVQLALLAQVDPLADQRRAPAAVAVLAIRRRTVSSPTNERHLEFGMDVIRVPRIRH